VAADPAGRAAAGGYNPAMAFRPDVTVAAIIEREGRFLVVEERAARRIVFNQPAGHLERGESLLEAVVRETLEETAYSLVPEAVTGIYLWRHPDIDRTFLRVAFAGSVAGPDPALRLDRCVLRVAWMTRSQLAGRPKALRSPLVLRCIDDYLAGTRHPLSLLATIGIEPGTDPVAAG
jgi:8-oxo-dGTP pyrophosphatase MutT (NUDIX family)